MIIPHQKGLLLELSTSLAALGISLMEDLGDEEEGLNDLEEVLSFSQTSSSA